ncbi:ABC transporter permease [Enterococcus avium]|uniref:ABC transporter permease n=1 Tax=Enterococcus avium TaxID=33945 RepID=UPI001F57CA61|nr:ABC transporter permease [Enterococcus avium]
MGKTDLLVTSKNSEKKVDIQSIKKMCQSTTVENTYELSGQVFQKKDEESISTLLQGLDIKQALKLNLFGYKENKLNLKNDEIIISQKTASKFDYHTGDTITIYSSTDSPIRKLTITKIVDNKGILALENDFPMLICSKKVAENILEESDTNASAVYIDVKNNDEINNLKKKLVKNLNLKVNRLIDPDTLKSASNQIRNVFYLVFIGISVSVLFITNTLLKMLLNERIPHFATFQSMGATNHQIVQVLIFENTLYGILGGAIGITVAILLKNSISSVLFPTSEQIKIVSTGFSISMKYLIAAFLLPIILQLLVTLLVAQLNKKKEIKKLIFETQDSKYYYNQKIFFLGLICLAIVTLYLISSLENSIYLGMIAFVLACYGFICLTPRLISLVSKFLNLITKSYFFDYSIRNVTNSKILMSSSQLLIIVMALIFSIMILTNSVNTMISGFERAFSCNIMVSGLSKEEGKYDYIKKVSGVDDLVFSYYKETPAFINNHEMHLTIVSNSEADKTLNHFKGIVFEKNKAYRNLKDNETILDNYLRKKYKLKKGQSIVLKVTQEDTTKKLKLKIAGFCDSSNFEPTRTTAVLNGSTYQKNITSIPTNILIKSQKPIKRTIDNINNVSNDFGMHVQTVPDYLESRLDASLPILTIVRIIISVACLLTIIGVLNNQLISFIQRKREIAVLNSVCMSKRQLSYMFIVETVYMFIIALIFSVVLGALLMLVLTKILEETVFNIPIIYNINQILKLNICLFCILLTINIIPIHKLNKLNIVSEIKYE